MDAKFQMDGYIFLGFSALYDMVFCSFDPSSPMTDLIDCPSGVSVKVKMSALLRFVDEPSCKYTCGRRLCRLLTSPKTLCCACLVCMSIWADIGTAQHDAGSS